MASSIEQMTTNFENDAATAFVNGKNADRIENEKKKVALGDIKNAPAVPVHSDGKPTVKNVDVDIDKEEFPTEYVSSRPVDVFDSMVEKLTFTDEEVNCWVKMLNIGWSNTYDEIEPPLPEVDYSPLEPYEPIEEWSPPDLVMSAIPESLQPSPGSDSSEYHSCETSFEEENEKSLTSPDFHDSELSALNQSVFELSSDFDDSF